jgi:DNA polymerase-3 subunit epsilon
MGMMSLNGGDERADSVVVLDFETTGLSPDGGDRAIEIGAVRLENGEVVERFQELMNPGFRISSFIEQYTGISNAMLAEAPPCEDVMLRFAGFIEGSNLVAHNASFDKRFLDSELKMIGSGYTGSFACSMLVSRRVYPEAPNHKLEGLVRFISIKREQVFHRALADSEMTARLWMRMIEDVGDRYGIWDIPFSMMLTLSRMNKERVHRFLSSVLRQDQSGRETGMIDR